MTEHSKPRSHKSPLWWLGRRSVRESAVAYSLIAGQLGLIAFFGLVPVLLSFILSFTYWLPGRMHWVGLENYREVLHSRVFWISMRNAAIYTTLALPVGIAIALLLAGLIQRLNSLHLRSLIRGGLYLPGVVSGVVMTGIWFYMLSSTGAVNGLLSLFGLGPSNWLGDRRLALFSIVLMSWLGSHGSGVVILSAAMGNIPRDLYEVARLDGARWRQEFIYITIPLVKPAVVFMIVTGTIGSFQIFNPVYIMTRGGPAHATMTISYLIFETAFTQFDFGVATAQTVLMAIGVLALALVQFKYMATDIEY